MAITLVRGTQVLDEGITRADLNVSVPGSAVIRKLILAGSLSAQGMTLASTGADAGTGDVTLGGTLTASAAPAGASTQIQYNNGGAAAGATNAIVSGNDFAAGPPGVLAAAPAGFTKYVARRSGNLLPATIDDTLAVGRSLRLDYGDEEVRGISAIPSATTFSVWGATNVTALGTATARTIGVTNAFTQNPRVGNVSAATAAAVAGVRIATAYFFLSTTANLGGFKSVQIFGTSDAAAVAGARMFAGLQPPTTPTNVEPTTVINSVGVGQIASSNNLQLISVNSAGVSSVVDLGANFPANGLSADMYKLVLYAEPGQTATVYYYLERLGTNFISSGTITTNLPAAGTLLAQVVWRTNNATALAVGVDVSKMLFSWPRRGGV